MKRDFPSARLRDSEGFTIVEVLVAALILVIGLLATFMLLDVSVRASGTIRAREGALTLAREVTEDAHAISYSQLSPSTITTMLEAMPGLATTSGSSWQVIRRGVTYTLTATECSIDDPKDGYGVHDSTFCADSSQVGSADQQPVDMKRVTANVSWTEGRLTHSVQEATTVTSAGLVVGFVTSNLQLATPAIGTGVSGTSYQPTVTSTGVSQLTFSVSAPAEATAILWTVNGVAQAWTSTVVGTTWTSAPWSIGGLSDGSYQLGAQAQDSSGVIGPAITIPVTLTRNIPTAPTVTGYGFNTNLLVGGTPSTAAELQWQPNPELNVTGYKIFNPSGTLICTTSNSTVNTACGTHAWCTTETACIDLSPPATNASNLTYQVAALYFSAGVLRQAPASSVSLTGGDVTTYALAPTAQNTGDNCVGPIAKDLLSAYAAGSDTTQSGGTVTFCSPSFGAGATLGNGGTATVYLANPGASSCTATATFSVDGGSAGALTATQTLAHGPPAAYSFSFPSASTLRLSAGDRLDLSFALSGACALHYGGSSYPGQFVTTPLAIAAPPPPASLTVSPQPDGTAVLSWPIVAGGATPASFYRIYRDGSNYGSRYDTVDAATCSNTCTYTDKQRNGSHSYSVTSVGGTTPGSNMSESTMTGSVNG